MPEYLGWAISRWTYSWLNPLLKTGKDHILTINDLWTLDGQFTAETLGGKLDECWAKERKRKDGEKSSSAMRLFRALFDAFGRNYLIASVYMFLYCLLQVSSSIILLYLIKWIQAGSFRSYGVWYGYTLGVALFIVQLGGTLCYNWHLEMTTKLGYRLRTCLISAIYKKAFIISNEARKEFTVGKITNLTATDTNRIDQSCQWNHYCWAAPFQILVSVGLLIWILGPSALVGFGVVAVYIPFQFRIIKVLSGFRRSANKFMDKRVKLIQEVLLGIRVVKMYAWESSFLDMITKSRLEELKQIRGFLFSRAVVNGVTQVVPTIAMLLSFVCYTLVGNPLDPAVVFAALQLFYTIRNPMTFLPMIVTMGVDAWFGMGRIGEFLLASEMEDGSTRLPRSDNPDDPSIEIKDGHFQWQQPTTAPAPENGVKAPAAPPNVDIQLKENTHNVFELNHVQLRIPSGKLVAVVGKVGSGKSSLLNALVGEMSRVSGTVTFRGSVGYCQQQAWIQNTTVRENILFGKQYDEKQYNEVIRACSLERDFAILPNGDETEIGERGINLSGGQKQRVQIARALYFDPDIVLFDDPLSAVDAHVGRALFENCLLGKLAGKTRVLVTHQLHFLPKVDIVVLMEAGKIVAQTSFEELLRTNESFAKLMQEFGGHEEEEGEPKDLNIVKSELNEKNATAASIDEDSKQEIKKSEKFSKDAKVTKKSAEALKENTQPKIKKGLMMVEERNEGAVQLKFYARYMKLCGGGVALLGLFLVIFMAQGSRVMTDQWLTYWTDHAFALTMAQYIGIYIGKCVVKYGLFLAKCVVDTGWCLFQAVMNVVYGITMSYLGTLGSLNMHREALTSVLRSPLSFFDATPLGRITSRFSRDFDGVDNMLPLLLYQLVQTTFSTLANFILIAINIPAFLGPLVVMLIGYYMIQVYYRATARELKRLDSISRSPLLANVSESMTGLATIRAYAASHRFIAKNSSLMDTNNRAYYPALLIQRWIQLRVEGLNAFLVLATSMFVILFGGGLSPQMSGLVLVYVTQATTALTAVVRQSADAEINMNSAERVIHYIDDLEREGGTEVVATKGLDPAWPQMGKLEIKDVVLKYRSDLPPVLHGVSVSVEPGTMIGIVGRTGAGKSTILTCILRLFEYESGSIVIDGVDIKTVGLRDLRHRIGVIPQEPVLFSGTIRSNLDPFGKYQDADLWSALERSDLKGVVSGSTGGLDAIVTENGENWSTGQRQLICLARAILKDAKIIMLDEATASVDLATDEFIQRAIRTNFINSTVLTIAHRLNTIADYDKILVMGAGKVIEFGRPKDLLEDEESHFSKMVAETGPNNAAAIRELANKGN
ncbi:P-loop containing nucleoside triphosphate hydrolase protein [Chytriomyces sp. MP71]|nr:P-loop containing nucleoside triphosphate hydrolase protein [Chytriomyces sp. MP71]